MIAGLKGVIEELRVGSVLLNVRDVIYEIYVSLNTLSELKDKEEKRFYISEIIREDAYLLFGFLYKEEQRIFERLIKINGVGPKVAMAILSTYTPQKFAQIIEQKNISALQKVSGIGARGASKIMVDLSGFFDFQTTCKDENQKVRDEATLALESLGFKKSEIEKVLKNMDCSEITQTIKEALKKLQNI